MAKKSGKAVSTKTIVQKSSKTVRKKTTKARTVTRSSTVSKAKTVSRIVPRRSQKGTESKPHKTWSSRYIQMGSNFDTRTFLLLDYNGGDITVLVSPETSKKIVVPPAPGKFAHAVFDLTIREMDSDWIHGEVVSGEFVEWVGKKGIKAVRKAKGDTEEFPLP